MILHEPRSLGYYAASHWLLSAVAMLALGGLVLGLLSALSDAKERAERLMVELTIRNMRTGMQFAMGEALIQQRESEMVSWTGTNPLRWLGSSPAGYRGECSVEESRDLLAGEWCFERVGRELVYRPLNADHLRDLSRGREEQCGKLSWHVVDVTGNAENPGFVGLRIEAASSCWWVLE